MVLYVRMCTRSWAFRRYTYSRITVFAYDRRSSSHCRLLTVEYVYGDRFRLSITGVTSVLSGVRRFRFLHQEEARRGLALLRDNGDAASARVVADYLKHRSGRLRAKTILSCVSPGSWRSARSGKGRKRTSERSANVKYIYIYIVFIG